MNDIAHAQSIRADVIAKWRQLALSSEKFADPAAWRVQKKYRDTFWQIKKKT